MRARPLRNKVAFVGGTGDQRRRTWAFGCSRRLATLSGFPQPGMYQFHLRRKSQQHTMRLNQESAWARRFDWFLCYRKGRIARRRRSGPVCFSAVLGINPDEPNIAPISISMHDRAQSAEHDCSRQKATAPWNTKPFLASWLSSCVVRTMPTCCVAMVKWL